MDRETHGTSNKPTGRACYHSTACECRQCQIPDHGSAAPSDHTRPASYTNDPALTNLSPANKTQTNRLNHG